MRQFRCRMRRWCGLHQFFQITGGVQCLQVAKLLFQLVHQPSFPTEIVSTAGFRRLINPEKYRGVGIFQQMIKQRWMVSLVFQGDQPQACIREFRIVHQSGRIAGK